MNFASKFEKLLSCEQVVLLKIVNNDKLEWVNQYSKKKVSLDGKLSLKDKLIYECFSENESFVINEPDKDMLFHPKLGKVFSITP